MDTTIEFQMQASHMNVRKSWQMMKEADTRHILVVDLLAGLSFPSCHASQLQVGVHGQSPSVPNEERKRERVALSWATSKGGPGTEHEEV